jgi:endonuclease YncB( thermonuclease family)
MIQYPINWENIHDNNTVEFSFKGLIIEAKCVKVYDGDSIKIVFPFNDMLIKLTIRLALVDTPELHDTNEKVKNYAYFVRDQLREKIFNKMIIVHLYNYDKYGRTLADIYIVNNLGKKEHINTWLIENKYGIKYNGGTKSDWSLLI